MSSANRKTIETKLAFFYFHIFCPVSVLSYWKAHFRTRIRKFRTGWQPCTGGTWCQVICHTNSLCLNSLTSLILMEMTRDPLKPQDICHTHPVALPNSVLIVMFMEAQVFQATCCTYYQHPMWSTLTKASMGVLECQAICLPRHKCMDSRTPIQVPLKPQLCLALLWWIASPMQVVACTFSL